MSRIGAEILGGLAAGGNVTLDAQQLAMQLRQMQQREAEQTRALYQERAARTYNMGEMERLSPPPTAGNAGASSQTMEAFANLPASMQQEEVARAREHARARENMEIARPVLDALRRDGLEAEAADIEYRVKNDMPIPEWSGAFRLKKKEDFDPAGFAGELPGMGWNPQQADMLGRFAMTTGQRPTGAMAQKAWEMGQPGGGGWTPDQLGSMLPGLQGADLWANKMNAGATTFNDAQQAAYRTQGGARTPFRMVDVDVEQETVNGPQPTRIQVPWGDGRPIPPHVETLIRQVVGRLVAPVGSDVARDGVFSDTQQTPESHAQAVEAKFREIAQGAGWELGESTGPAPTAPAAGSAPASRGSLDEQVQKLVDMGITDRARIKQIIKGEEAWPAPSR